MMDTNHSTTTFNYKKTMGHSITTEIKDIIPTTLTDYVHPQNKAQQ